MPRVQTNGVSTYYERRGDGPPVVAADVLDATLREVPGADHASNLDEPEFFTRVLREYLAEVQE